jgi:hypothetical protein
VRIPSLRSTQSQISSGKTLPIEGSSDEDLYLEILVQDLYNLLRVVFPDPAVAPSLLVRAFEIHSVSPDVNASTSLLDTAWVAPLL